ncbi:NAD(P)/FAD-dependent oxidoreductase [Lutibacter sp. HS1-25]|uniref:NAD(P)/FAD-dependent oxidoreductase n=1 Tax=Lutibacter sp. HS1-25 TaxID=2485000 RepID=UPI0010120894|nr:FAD-dependent oxidoreductase [Lutibacter sp. HS1-25]RXP56576.1 NAD(P)/FAD-dependent oxidoreductase [Lutibacter sp. HS1-25]
MAKVVVLGAGISGHTAVSYLSKSLKKDHEVVMISPNSNFQWVPSNIWVGVGLMTTDQVKFELAPVYKKMGVIHKQALAVAINPEGDLEHEKGFVTIKYVSKDKKDIEEKVTYDYLINATGPKLNFEATEGLGPQKFTESVCTYDHASHAWAKLEASLKKMEQGEPQTFLIGTGHPMATCQGAAFEYVLNIAFEINKRKLNHLADLWWITNEYELGDFGMGGAYVKRNGYITPTKIFTESILKEYGVKWIKQAGVKKVEKGVVHYETLDGKLDSKAFDFAMLIPGFSGVDMNAFDKQGNDITKIVFAANGMMKVDADYNLKPYEEWKAKDWPLIYQSSTYKNIYAAGIAFAPPHAMSKPMQSPNGTKIFPTPPRTGMPSGVIGKIVAQNIIHQIKTGKDDHPHQASMAKMGAACIVSAGYGFTKGQAAVMTVKPIVPDWETYPKWGRNIDDTVGVVGTAGHWMKLFMHYMFIYKAKAKPFWWLIPE